MTLDVTDVGKRLLSKVCRSALGRRNFARLGRFLWLQSRLDVANGFRQNGESEIQDALLRYLEAGGEGAVFDVGANVGEWSGHLLEKSTNTAPLELVLFEPSPGARRRIEGELSSQLQEKNTRLEPLALTDAEGTATFFINAPTAGTNSLRSVTGDPAIEELQVECTTIDRYCSQHDIDRLAFVKIDTEGNDCNVIKGASQMLADRRIDFIQFEYNYRWVAFRHFLKDVFDLIEPMGLAVGKITPEGVEQYEDWHFELETYREGNYLIYDPSNRLPTRHFPWWNAA